MRHNEQPDADVNPREVCTIDPLASAWHLAPGQSTSAPLGYLTVYKKVASLLETNGVIRFQLALSVA